MKYQVFRILVSVKAKLFFGFLAMTTIIFLLGGYAFISIGNAGDVVEDTFDRPLMAINFSRSAGQVFNDLEIEVLKQTTGPGSDAPLDVATIALLIERFQDDIAVARQRSISTKATAFFDTVDEQFVVWKSLRGVFADDKSSSDFLRANDVASDIKEQLEIIVELQAGEAFLAREAAIENMAAIKRYNAVAGGVGLMVTLLISAWISVTIISPLKAAANAARKISDGDFNVDIPPGGDDETGVLLKTLSAMQKNIRNRMGQEQTLRTLAQYRLSDSVGNSEDAILLTNAQGLIIVANPRIGEMFPALNEVELIQRPFADFFSPEGSALSEACSFDASRRELCFDDVRWARISASSTREGGQLYIWSDITDAKIRSRRLREAKDAAEAADKAKTLFLAAMSHELRTPLNAVIGFSDILVADNEGETGNATHAELAGLISQSGAQLLNIVKDVLAVAHGEETEMNAELTRMNINDVVEFCMKTVASEAKDKGVRLIYDVLALPTIVSGDELRLQQMLLNLLSNAIKYNREGGAVRVKVSSNAKGETYLDVIDNGIGIDAPDIEKIMLPFVQVDDGYTRKYDGVGLGLTIVKQILDLHQGSIEIRSRLENGTVVRIIFPALTRSSPEAARQSA